MTERLLTNAKSYFYYLFWIFEPVALCVDMAGLKLTESIYLLSAGIKA